MPPTFKINLPAVEGAQPRKHHRAPPPAPSSIEGVYKMEDDGLMQRFLFIEEVSLLCSLRRLLSVEP